MHDYRNIGQEIFDGIEDIKAYKAGKQVLTVHTGTPRSSPKEIRANLKISQAAFAGLLGVSLRTVQDWEQGRRKPSGPAEILLCIAEQNPGVFLKIS